MRSTVKQVASELATLLSTFCDTLGDVRFPEMGEPFVLDGYIYATDAIIIVRVPCADPDSSSFVREAQRLFRNFPDCHVPWTYPETSCAECGDTGCVSLETCPACGKRREERDRKCRVCSATELMSASRDSSLSPCPACGGCGECQTCSGATWDPFVESCAAWSDPTKQDTIDLFRGKFAARREEMKGSGKRN